VVVPTVFGRLRIEKGRVRALLLATPLTTELSVTLNEAGSMPPDMVRVPASVFNMPLPSLDHLKAEPIGAFLIDKCEVTNRAFKRFMDSGGYLGRKYWKHRSCRMAGCCPGTSAVRFKDRTGRTGPATWEAGTYPDGQADYPVSGVSWYEAAAFAEFAEKSLPTIYHWYTARVWGQAPGSFRSATWAARGRRPSATTRAPAVRHLDMAGTCASGAGTQHPRGTAVHSRRRLGRFQRTPSAATR